jgi:hypothetical protein
LELDASAIKEAKVLAEKWQGQWGGGNMVEVRENREIKALGVTKYADIS